MSGFTKSTVHMENYNGIPVTIPNKVSFESRCHLKNRPNVFHASMFGLDPTSRSWEREGFYISYNNYDRSHYGSDTTALVWGQMYYFLTLNGDHRKAYEPLTPLGFEACFAYFKENKQSWNKYTEPDNTMMVLEMKLAHPVERMNFLKARFVSSVF